MMTEEAAMNCTDPRPRLIAVASAALVLSLSLGGGIAAKAQERNPPVGDQPTTEHRPGGCPEGPPCPGASEELHIPSDEAASESMGGGFELPAEHRPGGCPEGPPCADTLEPFSATPND
jgi:hypothetical protein